MNNLNVTSRNTWLNSLFLYSRGVAGTNLESLQELLAPPLDESWVFPEAIRMQILTLQRELQQPESVNNPFWMWVPSTVRAICDYMEAHDSSYVRTQSPQKRTRLISSPNEFFLNDSSDDENSDAKNLSFNEG